MNRVFRYALLIAGILSPLGCASGNPIHTGHLLDEMTDMRRLAESPQPSYKTVQFSSFDRSSSLPGGPGWFANSDGFGGEKTPGFEAVLVEPGEDGIGEYLICDVTGPGAIVRTWTAAIEGSIRLYLDDLGKPVYDGSAADFLFCPYQVFAEENGIDPQAMRDGFQQHQASYCPIPFARRCRMIWVGNVKKVHFYQVQIRLYEPGTVLETFDPTDLNRFNERLQHATRALTDSKQELQPSADAIPAAIDATLQPHEQKEVLSLDGPRAIGQLQLKIAAADIDRALRQTVLHISFDGYPWGQVQSPLGDFFGAAPGINPYDSVPFTVAPDGTMTCRYFMPFASSAKIVIENKGDQDVTITGAAWPVEYEWTGNSLHFRARWRVDHGLVGDPKAVQDMPFLLAYGAGRYVGSALMLMNPANVSTPYGSWWGEGDEKIFVDGDEVPSTFGTGSEDYFNYAWSVPDIFAHAYCGQPRNDGPGNRGFVTNNRWHIIDDLPFNQRFAFYLELYPHMRTPGMSYARIGYYYAKPETMDDHVAITDEDVRPLALPASWEPIASYGMRNSVFHPAEDILAPGPEISREAGSLWAGGELNVWQPKAVGEELEMRFAIDEDGKYGLYLALELSPESGAFWARLDGEPIEFSGNRTVDLYVPYRLLARQRGTKTTELTKGEHTLTLVYSGAPNSVAEPRIGIDFLAVQRRR